MLGNLDGVLVRGSRGGGEEGPEVGYEGRRGDAVDVDDGP